METACNSDNSFIAVLLEVWAPRPQAPEAPWRGRSWRPSAPSQRGDGDTGVSISGAECREKVSKHKQETGNVLLVFGNDNSKTS